MELNYDIAGLSAKFLSSKIIKENLKITTIGSLISLQSWIIAFYGFVNEFVKESFVFACN